LDVIITYALLPHITSCEGNKIWLKTMVIFRWCIYLDCSVYKECAVANNLEFSSPLWKRKTSISFAKRKFNFLIAKNGVYERTEYSDAKYIMGSI